jgi:UDP-galactopyranose mutase
MRAAIDTGSGGYRPETGRHSVREGGSMSNRLYYDVAILGGGITGLTAACRLQQADSLLLEKEQIPGGLARTDDLEGFRFDFGVHVWFTRNESAEGLLRSLSPLAMQTHRRSAWVQIYGRLVPAPFQANLHGLPLHVVSECLIGYAEALRSQLGSRNSFADWLRGSLGDGIYKHFMQPYNTKIWTVPPEELTADWPGSRVDVPDARQMIAGALGIQVNDLGPNAHFGYPSRDGIGAIAGAMSSQCRNVLTGACIRGIDLGAKTLHLADGTDVIYRSAISTIPLVDLLRLVGSTPSAIDNAASQLRSTKVLLVNLALKRRPDHGCHWIYFAEPEYPFFRVSFPHNFAESMCPVGAGSIQAECAFPSTAAIDESAVMDRTTALLSEAGYLDTSQLLFVRTRIVNPAYVICDHKRRENLQLILSYLLQQDVYCAGRFGTWEYMNLDHCLLAGMEAADWSQTRPSTTAANSCSSPH